MDAGGVLNSNKTNTEAAMLSTDPFKVWVDLIRKLISLNQFKRPPKVIERKIRVPKARPGGPRRNRSCVESKIDK